MKGKGNGLAAIKGLALKHGEKAVMLLVVLAAVWLIKSTMSHESLDPRNSPKNLESQATQVSQSLQNYSWTEAQENGAEEVRIFKPVQSASLEVPDDPYKLSGVDPMVVPPVELRKDPKLLPVAEYEVHALTGLFGFIDEEVARNKDLAAAREAARTQLDREREQERAARDEGNNRGGRGGGRGGFDMGFGRDGLAGEDENRRPVAVPLPRAGVDLDGSELIRRLSCAVVMAKVPLPEQLQEYKNALSASKGYDPSRDYPQYFGYVVQRATVSEDGGELQWKTLRFPNGHYKIEGDNKRFFSAITNAPGLEYIDKMIFNWAGGLEDIHDPRYDHYNLTVPQAPLVGRNWDELAYMSEIPLASEVEEMMEERLDEGAPAAGTEEEEEGGIDFGAATGGIGGARGGVGGEFGGRGGEFGGRGGGRRSGMGIGRGGMGRRGGGEFDGGGRGMGGGRAGGIRSGGGESFDANGNLIVEVPFLMLRFFDMTVQPGQKYKYRVQLILQDPNYQMPTSVLEPEVAARDRKPAIYGEWSEASPTVVVPQAGIIRLAESTPPRGGAYGEPGATMLVESFGLDEKNNAMQVYKELEGVNRGSVMNYKGEVEMLVDQGRYIETVEDFTIDTGVMVLDLEGGDSYSRDLKEPTHALMMDSSGRMYLRDELDDEMEVAIHRAVFAETENTGPGRFDPGMRGGGRGGGEFEF